jgi:phosphoserine phosphatase
MPSLFKEFEFVLLSLEPQILVSEIASYLKIPNYVCNTFEEKNNVITNSKQILTNKIEILENSEFNNRSIIAAFGDSENDYEILRKAKLKMVINPTPTLFEKIKDNKDFKITNPKIATDEFKKYIINFI